MKVEMTACDNPDCEEVTADLYGWVHSVVTFIGSGPTVEVETCSLECVSPGTEAATERQHWEEVERTRAQSERLRQCILEQDCPTCGCKPGYPCITGRGKEKPEPHAARRDAGLAAYRADREDNPQ